jgi:hypothetical protein
VWQFVRSGINASMGLIVNEYGQKDGTLAAGEA